MSAERAKEKEMEDMTAKITPNLIVRTLGNKGGPTRGHSRVAPYLS